MLRRKIQDTEDRIQTKVHKRQKRKKESILGEKDLKKDSEEKQLESYVLGGEEEVIHVLENHSHDDDSKRKTVTEGQRSTAGKNTKVAWVDEDDVNERCQKTPKWAELRIPWERSGDSDDSDVEDLLQKTGNYIATSTTLPKGILQYKQCTDANHDSPTKSRLTSVEFHPKSQVILTAGMNNTLSLFQVDGKTNPKIQSIFVENYPIHTAHFSANGEEVIMGSKHKSFYYFDMMSGKIINVPWIKGLEETNMKRFEVSPDGRFIVFLGKYGAMHFISAKSKEWMSTQHMRGGVQSVCFSKDGTKMYSHGDDGEVFVWDMTTRQCIHHFYDEGCTQGTMVTVSHDNQYLACGSYSGVVNVYNTETCMQSRSPKPLKAIMNLTTSCTSAAFNSTSEILAISSDYTEKAVKLVHVPSLTVFSNFPERADENLRIPQCLDFSVNSGYFSVGTHKGHALLYRLKHYGNY